MLNPFLSPTRALEKKKEAQGSGPGEGEKLSRSRVPAGKMQADSEVKGKRNSQGSGA